MEYEFCCCCDDSVFELARMSLTERLNGTDNEGMKDVLMATSMNDIGTKGSELVEWCIDFLLLMKKHEGGIDIKKRNPDQKKMHLNKYITIWSFIYDFLKIPKGSGYDYWLLSFLEWNKFLDHGGGIRCGWWCGPKNYRTLSVEREWAIMTWCENCSDDV